MWKLDDEIYLDPTNDEGYLDLELKFAFGLYKVSTILARINEPPPGRDINVYTTITGSDVSFIAERDIVVDGKSTFPAILLS
jgi:hypothetical protein